MTEEEMRRLNSLYILVLLIMGLCCVDFTFADGPKSLLEDQIFIQEQAADFIADEIDKFQKEVEAPKPNSREDFRRKVLKALDSFNANDSYDAFWKRLKQRGIDVSPFIRNAWLDDIRDPTNVNFIEWIPTTKATLLKEMARSRAFLNELKSKPEIRNTQSFLQSSLKDAIDYYLERYTRIIQDKWNLFGTPLFQLLTKDFTREAYVFLRKMHGRLNDFHEYEVNREQRRYVTEVQHFNISPVPVLNLEQIITPVDARSAYILRMIGEGFISDESKKILFSQKRNGAQVTVSFISSYDERVIHGIVGWATIMSARIVIQPRDASLKEHIIEYEVQYFGRYAGERDFIGDMRSYCLGMTIQDELDRRIKELVKDTPSSAESGPNMKEIDAKLSALEELIKRQQAPIPPTPLAQPSLVTVGEIEALTEVNFEGQIVQLEDGSIGKGGLGVVRVGVKQDGTRVAVKFLYDAGRVSDLEASAHDANQYLDKSDRDYAVRIYEMNADAEIPYAVMEYVEGEDLEKKIQRDGPLPPEDVFRYMDQLFNIVSDLHKKDVVHGDLKPHNILLDKKGDIVKLTDFGGVERLAPKESPDGSRLAHSLSRKDMDEHRQTTQQYQPEDRRGSHPSIDIYSLGKILFEMMVGRLPTGSETPFTVISRKAFHNDIPAQRWTEDVGKSNLEDLSDFYSMLVSHGEDTFRNVNDAKSKFESMRRGVYGSDDALNDFEDFDRDLSQFEKDIDKLNEKIKKADAEGRSEPSKKDRHKPRRGGRRGR